MDDQTQPTFEMTPGFKPFTVLTWIYIRNQCKENYKGGNRPVTGNIMRIFLIQKHGIEIGDDISRMN